MNCLFKIKRSYSCKNNGQKIKKWGHGKFKIEPLTFFGNKSAVVLLFYNPGSAVVF